MRCLDVPSIAAAQSGFSSTTGLLRSSTGDAAAACGIMSANWCHCLSGLILVTIVILFGIFDDADGDLLRRCDGKK